MCENKRLSSVISDKKKSAAIRSHHGIITYGLCQLEAATRTSRCFFPITFFYLLQLFSNSSFTLHFPFATGCPPLSAPHCVSVGHLVRLTLQASVRVLDHFRKFVASTACQRRPLASQPPPPLLKNIHQGMSMPPQRH